MDFFIHPESYLSAKFGRLTSNNWCDLIAPIALLRDLCWRYRFPRSLVETSYESVNSELGGAPYGVGSGAVDPAGIGEGASLEPCVFGGFLFAAALWADGVGVGWAIAGAVVLVPVVPDCWQDAKNDMPIRTAIRENRCLFIGIFSDRASQCVWLPIVIEKVNRCSVGLWTVAEPEPVQPNVWT